MPTVSSAAPAPTPAGSRGRLWARSSIGFFVLLLGLYAGVHLGLRLVLSPVVGIDDAREALLSQTLQFGYLPRQPPLYNWLVWASVRLLGANTVALAVCRYVTLSLVYLFLYLSATQLLGRGRPAMMAAFSLILMGPYTWEAHQELTHSLAATAAAAATFYALLRLGQSGSVLAYLGLGVALAAGFLAKFSYGLFAGSLLAAAIVTPAYRRRILAPRFAFTVGIGLLLCLPYALWFLDQDLSIMRMYEEGLRKPIASYRRGVARSLFHLGRMILINLTPFWLVFLVVFWGAWRRRPTSLGGVRLLGALLLIEGAVLIAGILTGNLTEFRVRWLMPAFVLVPLFAFAWVDAPALDPRRMVRYAVALLVVETLVVLALSANVLRGDAFASPTRLNAPYDLVGDALTTAGFTRGTIAAGEGPLAGNLRLRFPDSRVIRLQNPEYLPPAVAEGQCLVVWEEPGRERPRLLAWVATALAARVEGEAPQPIAASYHHSRTHWLRVSYILIPTGRGNCH
jgi:4-amino-4-deoxy-L-arabinose transferase-like glycosyltransferase